LKSNYKKLGPYIQEVNVRNTDLAVDRLLGVSVKKVFIPSVANTVGTNFRRYKIVKRNQFTYIPDTSRRGDKIGLAFLEEYENALVSQAYTVFKVVDESKLLPNYLMMWFRRPEFDRYARYKSHGSVREIFGWDEMCEVELPIPSIEKQREIVKEYNTVVNRIKLNEELNQKLEETAQALYKHWFVDFEFPCLPSDYRPHGQVNLKISDEALRRKIANVCTYKRIGGLPIADGRTWYVYLILCDDDSIYKGITNDLHRRFYEHYTGAGAQHTQQHKPVKIIHWEAFDTRTQAAKREKDLKTGYGRTWISRQIEKAGGLTAIKTGSPAPQTALRTAGEMVYNEELDMEIPEGWSVYSLRDIVNGNPENLSKNEIFSTIQYLETSNITRNKIEDLKHLNLFEDKVPSRAKRKVKHNDIIYSTVRPALCHYGLLRHPDKNLIVSTGFSVLRAKKMELSEVVYQFLVSDEITNSLQAKAEMSVSTYPSITIDDILNLKLALPKKNLIGGFKEIGEQINFKNFESKKLEELKELLLSKMTRVEEEKTEIV